MEERAPVRIQVEEIIGQAGSSPSGHIPCTPRAKKVLEMALRESLQLGHNYIGTEHILLGLIREGEGVAAQVLVTLGADLGPLRAAVITAVNQPAADPRRRRAPRTPAVEEALANAQRLAASAPMMGSHHLLEALARSDDSLASQVLASLGVDADAIAAKIDEIGIDGSSDSTPEEDAARMMEIRLEGDTAHLVLRDDVIVAMARAITESLGGDVRGDAAIVGSLADLWCAIAKRLDELWIRVTPIADQAPTRSTLAHQLIRSRLARRRRNR